MKEKMAHSKPTDLVGQNVVVLGVGGVGLAIAQAAKAAEADVFMADIKHPSRFEGIDLSLIGEYYQTDLTSDFEIELLVKQLRDETLGSLAVVMSTVYQPPRTRNIRFDELPATEVENFIQIGLMSYLRPLHQLLPLLIERGGKVVIFSSINGRLTNVGNVMYSTVKGAQMQMTRALALDYEKHGITVNCIAPGAILSPLNSTPEAIAAQPGLRFGSVSGAIPSLEDVARVTLTLLGDGMPFVSGVVIEVGGSPHLEHSYGAADRVVASLAG